MPLGMIINHNLNTQSRIEDLKSIEKSNLTVTVFRNCISYENYNLSLNKIYELIVQGKYRIKISELRTKISLDKDAYQKFKLSELPAFTPSGTFEKGKSLKNIIHYNKLIVLDFDNIPENRFVEVFQKSKEIPFTLISFKSPSGNGLKVLVPITSELEDHELAFSQVTSHYEKVLGLK